MGTSAGATDHTSTEMHATTTSTFDSSNLPDPSFDLGTLPWNMLNLDVDMDTLDWKTLFEDLT